MCGICGTIGLSNAGLINQMNKHMLHRGPDNIGVWCDKAVCLGHTRLSIIDTSPTGHQPMSNEDGTLWITFNGEIYNFQILRGELEQKGHIFRSRSDTEVILHLYEEYEEGCLERLRGMFSFAIWDNKKKRLFAARDRLGIKPFFYYHNDDIFIFSSELKPILRSGMVGSDIDSKAVADYFRYGSVQAPDTIIKGVSQLLPAHYIILENSKINISKFWELGISKIFSPHKREDEHICELMFILNEAVRIRMISDVPLAAFLSGGIDSSTITALMQQHSSRPIKTFSVIFEKECDERKFSNTMARELGTDHNQILLKENDVLKEMPNIFDAMDQPSIDGFNMFIVSNAVKKAGFKVALSGLGGDELFAGYQSFKVLPKLAAVLKFVKHIPNCFKDTLFNGISQTAGTKKRLKLFYALFKCNDLYDLYQLQRSVFLPNELRELLDDVSYSDKSDRGRPLDKNRDLINQISFLELDRYLQNMLLQDADRMSMANSLELRLPFLDHLLVEKMFQVPGAMKIGSDYPKRLLVKGMKNLLPEDIYNRPKVGFVLPFETWLRKGLRGYCEAKFAKRSLKNIAFLNSDKVYKLWADFLKGSRLYNYSSILSLLSFINWHERNI